MRETAHHFGAHYGAAFKCLTPSMLPRGGKLNVDMMRLGKGRTTCPYHLREDEVFCVLSGRRVLRYGDALREVRAGDCISCPAGEPVGHQRANPSRVDAQRLVRETRRCTYGHDWLVRARS